VGLRGLIKGNYIYGIANVIEIGSYMVNSLNLFFLK